MCRTLTYSVTDKDAGVEILDFLRSHGFSRHLLSSMKNDPGCIRLNEGLRGAVEHHLAV